MHKEFLITEDGSHTIYLPELDEHYHSIHGAIQESQHIYINQGLLQVQKTEINILEIGFGTGLNAYLTYCHSHNRIKVHYYSLEKFPLTVQEYSKLNYPETLFPENQSVFELMHQSDWDSEAAISKDFKLIKLRADLLSFKFDPLPQFDLVYYDAFAPVKQPEMWTDELLEKVANSVKKDGIFVTYCAKGSVRRALIGFGFHMERIPGPIGKKEILRGKKSI
ncbi:MAG: tRNA (5-methylaminomethyl-2-thiouridine)(34)-methyltransferase MnmD [Prolixibacteraceae bacterium]